jgi:hypothetical protein
MTEAEWLECDDPTPMIVSIHDRISARKVRLFAVACCQRVIDWTKIADRIHGSMLMADGSSVPFNRGDDYRNAIDTAERFADGEATEAQLNEACDAAGDNVLSGGDACDLDPFVSVALPDIAEVMLTARRIGQTCHDLIPWTPDDPRPTPAEVKALQECAAQVGLVHDIFGNPFRPAAFSAEWRTDTAVTLARQMYESRDFGAMPILADALQDAGCDNPDVLDHCRGVAGGDSGEPAGGSPAQTTHVRGCWVCDLVLGKA